MLTSCICLCLQAFHVLASTLLYEPPALALTVACMFTVGDAGGDKEEELDDEEIAAAEKEDAKELGEGAHAPLPRVPCATVY